MNQTLSPPEALEQLCQRVENLERRVSQLEQRPLAAPDAIVSATEPQALPPILPVATWQLGSTLTAVGIAFLGIAGAYVLRALAGAAVLPRLRLGLAGAAYSIGWAVAATRTRNRFAGGLYAFTSALMLASMLWEMCVRFHAIPPMLAAGILSVYVVTVIANARSSYRSPAFSFAFAGSAMTAFALAVGTRQMHLFLAILLAMAVFGEIVRLQTTRLPLSSPRLLPAGPVALLMADIATWALLFLYRQPAAARLDYPSLNPAAVLAAPALLFAIQLAAMAAHTWVRRQIIAVFDAAQIMVAFGLLATGVFWIAPALAGPTIGSLSLLLSAACYWAAFDPHRRMAQARNFGMFVTWAVALLVAGCYLLVSVPLASVAVAVAAVTASIAARRFHSTALELHSVLYLIVAAFACGWSVYVWQALITEMPTRPSATIVAVSLLSIAAYAAWHENQGPSLAGQLTLLAEALLASFALCALLAHALSALVALVVHPESQHFALLRTLAGSGLALSFAFAGARMHRVSMTRAAYTLLGFVVLKLAFEDLRHGHLAFLAGSIGLVAVTLIAVPRLARS